MKNEHKKEGLFLDFLKQLHLWGYSIADKSIFVHNRNEDATIEYFVYLASFSFRNASLCTILVDPLMKKYILNGKPTKISVI